TYPERRLAYAEALCAFHERWFWKHTAQADFRLSHLNRHYVLHSLGTESFYRPIDCHRLFLYFDTFADMLMLEGHGQARFPSAGGTFSFRWRLLALRAAAITTLASCWNRQTRMRRQNSKPRCFAS